MDPVLHALEQVPGYDIVVVLQPTSPLRKAQDINDGLDYFEQQSTSICVSISKVTQNPYGMFFLDNDNQPMVTKRQDLPKVYMPSRALFIAKTSYLQEQKTFYTQDTVGYIMPKERSYDIDDELDFVVCDFLCRKVVYKKYAIFYGCTIVMKKIIYIPVETKVRELDAKILLSIEAVKRGYVVLLGSKAMISKLKVLPKGILMYKDASSPMKDQFIAAKSVGHKIVVHDEEGFVWGSWEQYLNFRIKFETIRYVDTFLCWGGQQYRATIAVANMYAPQTKFSVVGHPRLDLLRKPLRNYNAPNVHNIRRILINTKLAECNHGQGPTAYIDMLMSHNILKSDEDISKAKEQVVYKKKLMFHYIELIKTLSKKFPTTEILVRPHPSENFESWVDITQDLNNVVVNNENPIGFWVHRSDVIIHTGCTTAIEAFLMDKPVITYKPLTDERFENKLPDSISLTSRSDSECVDLINDIFDNKLRFDAYKKNGLSILRESLDSIDGDFSFIKIMDEIDNLQPQAHLFSRVMKYKLRLLFIKSYIRSFVYNKPPTESKIKKFSKSEVVETLVKLNNALGRKDEVEVSKISHNLYMLTNPKHS